MDNNIKKEKNLKEMYNLIDCLVENDPNAAPYFDEEHPYKYLQSASVLEYIEDCINEDNGFIYTQDDLETMDIWDATQLNRYDAYEYYVKKYAEYYNVKLSLARNLSDYIVEPK